MWCSYGFKHSQNKNNQAKTFWCSYHCSILHQTCFFLTCETITKLFCSIQIQSLHLLVLSRQEIIPNTLIKKIIFLSTSI